MATVIDSLLVTLGLDASQFDRGQKDARDKLRKFEEEHDRSSKKQVEGNKAVSASLNGIKNEVFALAAVAIGASSIVGFFDNMIKTQAGLGRSAHFLNMNARELDAWGKSVKTVGGTAEGLTQSLQSIEGGITAFSMGQDSPVVQGFAQLGIALRDTNTGKMRDVKDIMLDLAGKMATLSPQKQIYAAQMLGLDQGTLNLLIKGRDAVKAIYDEQYKLSGVTEASTKQAEEAQAAWSTLGSTFNGIAQQLFVQLIPAMKGLNEQLMGFSNWVGGHKSEISDFFNSLVHPIDTFNKGQSRASGLLGRFWDWSSNNFQGPMPGESAAAAPSGKDASTTYGKVKGGASVPSAFFSSLERANGLPAGTLDAMWKQESGRGKNMVSPKGATGHFQFMPDTAVDFGMSRADTFDLQKSATAAAKYMGQLMRRYNGDFMKALAAYNGGMGNVDKGVYYPEMRNYSSMIGAAVNGQTAANNVTTTNNVKINVVTSAQDGQGIGRDIHRELSQNSLLFSANTGMR